MRGAMTGLGTGQGAGMVVRSGKGGARRGVTQVRLFRACAISARIRWTLSAESCIADVWLALDAKYPSCHFLRSAPMSLSTSSPLRCAVPWPREHAAADPADDTTEAAEGVGCVLFSAVEAAAAPVNIEKNGRISGARRPTTVGAREPVWNAADARCTEGLLVTSSNPLRNGIPVNAQNLRAAERVAGTGTVGPAFSVFIQGREPASGPAGV